MIESLLKKITSVQRSTYVLLLLLTAILAVAYSWGRTLYNAEDEARIPRQCDSVYVGKIPFACQPGDLIFVDADVADKYCTEEVFTKTETAVYCIYNGERDDRERDPSLFRTNTFGDINR